MNKFEKLILSLTLSLSACVSFASSNGRIVLPPRHDELIGLLKSGGGGCTGQEGKGKSNRQGTGGPGFPCEGISHPENVPKSEPKLLFISRKLLAAQDVQGIYRAVQMLDQIELSNELRAQLKKALVPSATHIYTFGLPNMNTEQPVVVTSGDQYVETTLLPGYTLLNPEDQAVALIRTAAKLVSSGLNL